MASLPPPYPTRPSPPDEPPAPAPSPPPTSLSTAVSRIRTLETYNAAHLSTIHSLSTLHQFEQIQSRVQRRTTNSSLPPSPAQNEQAELRANYVALQAQLSQQHALVQNLRIANDALREDLQLSQTAHTQLAQQIHQNHEHSQSLQAELHASQAVAASHTLALSEIPIFQTLIQEQKRAIQEKDAVIEALRGQSQHTTLTDTSDPPDARVSHSLLKEKDDTIAELSHQLSTATADVHHTNLSLQALKAREDALSTSLRDAQNKLAAQNPLIDPELHQEENILRSVDKSRHNSDISPDGHPLPNQLIAKVEVLRKLNDSLDGFESPNESGNTKMHLPDASGSQNLLSPSDASEAASDLALSLEQTAENQNERRLDTQSSRVTDIEYDPSNTPPSEIMHPSSTELETQPESHPQSSTASESKQDPDSTSQSSSDTTVQLLRRALEMARTDRKDKEKELAFSQNHVSNLQTSCQNLQSELDSRIEHCRNLEVRIRDDLEPALKNTLAVVKEKVAVIEAGKNKLSEQTQLSEETARSLQSGFSNTASRLEVTLASLSDAQRRLAESDQKGANGEERIALLLSERNQLLEEMDTLKREHDHTQQSLAALQKRFTELEMQIAEHGQVATDATRAKEQFERLFMQCRDRQDIAEKRATRKEGLLREHQLQNIELKRKNGVATDRLRERATVIQRNERELSQLRQILVVRDEALQDQAKLSCERETLFNSLSDDLKAATARKDDDLREQQGIVKEAKQQLAAMVKNLADSNVKLRNKERELGIAQATCRKGEQEIISKDSAVMESQKEVSRLSRRLQLLEEERCAKDDRISDQLESIAERGRRLTSLRTEKSNIENTLASRNSELAEQKRRYEELESKLVVNRNELDESNSKLTEIGRDLSARKSQIESLRSSLFVVQQELTDSRARETEKDEEIKQNTQATASLEGSLANSKHQLTALEQHLDGHDTILQECKEKDEELVSKEEDLKSMREDLTGLEGQYAAMTEKLMEQMEEAEEFRISAATLQSTKVALTKDLKKAQKARLLAEKSFDETSAKLSSLEDTSAKEIAELNNIIDSLQNSLDETEAALFTASEQITEISVQEKLNEEELHSSKNRGDQLLSKFISTQNELLYKTEAMNTLQQEFIEVQEALKTREMHVEKLEQKLANRNQTQSRTRGVFGSTGAANDNADGDTPSMRTKLEANEKAVMNLHNWCCFINGKLHAAEKALLEREMDLEVSTLALRRLEAQMEYLSETIAKKEEQVEQIDSSQVGVSELRAKIQTLLARVETVNCQLASRKDIPSKASDNSALMTLSMELRGCSDMLKKKELELSTAETRSMLVYDIIQAYEQEVEQIKKTIESLKLDFEKGQAERSSEGDTRHDSDMRSNKAAPEKPSGKAYLLCELKKMEAELIAANENAKNWKAKVEELQPFADSTLDSQMSAELLSSRLTLTEKDARQRIDLLETQLQDAIRERDTAERDCAAAMSDYSAMRTTLKAHESRTTKKSAASSARMCTVTFTLSGNDSPGPDIMVYIVGGIPVLGQWDPSFRTPLRVVSEDDGAVVRKCIVTMSVNTITFYKYVADGPNGEIVWEGGGNRSLELKGDVLYITSDTWRAPPLDIL